MASSLFATGCLPEIPDQDMEVKCETYQRFYEFYSSQRGIEKPAENSCDFHEKFFDTHYNSMNEAELEKWRQKNPY